MQNLLLSLPAEVGPSSRGDRQPGCTQLDCAREERGADSPIAPSQILIQTLSHLPPDALYAFSLTCRQANDLLLGDDDSWPAWKGSYCLLFDDPADSGWPVAAQAHGRAGRDWRALTQACFEAARALLEKRLGPATDVRAPLFATEAHPRKLTGRWAT